MPRRLTSRSSLDSLRREAKRLRKAMVPAPSLRDVQQGLARAYGFASWALLKQELEDRARTAEENIRLFLEKSVNRYGTDPASGKWGDYERDEPTRGVLAARLLARHPEIARDSIHTAVAAHDIEAVRGFLAKNPSLARDRSPFDGWPPLARLAYARLPIQAHALAIADLLLDAGADPNVGWSDDFTPMVGVIGGGEGEQTPHPQAEDFARLLIARGADPFAPQALYNISLGPDSTVWLDFMWSESEKRGETVKWTGPAPSALGGETVASALAYLLGNAVPNHIKWTQWLLEHGADASGRNFYSREPVIKHAILNGREDVASLLERYGAERPKLSELELFIAAINAGDLSMMRGLAETHPEFLANYTAMVFAINTGRTEIVEALLDLGMSPDIRDDKNFRALHYTTHRNEAEIARLLIARGAEIDPCETRHGGSPLTHANYFKRTEIIEILVPHSRNFRGLCFVGAVDRLRQLLTEEPDRVHSQDRPGETVLFCLPDDEDKAVEVAELLLSFGADPTFCNPAGQTPPRPHDGAASTKRLIYLVISLVPSSSLSA